MITIKKLLLLFVTALPMLAYSQEAPNEITQELNHFNRIIASPRINLILTEGETESIKLVYHRVSRDKINIDVSGKTLRIYLDDAKMTEKMERINHNEKRSIYHDASVTAYVTYRDLKHLEIRGEQELTCTSTLRAEKFTLKAYGRNEITLSSIKTGYLKTHLYGENRLIIDGGKAEFQKYKLYGENKIDTESLRSYATVATIFGESRLRLSTQDELKVNSFGESIVTYNGDAHVNKGLIVGRTEIRKMN